MPQSPLPRPPSCLEGDSEEVKFNTLVLWCRE